MELATTKYNLDPTFQMYVLTSNLVKSMLKEFEFYNVRFYKEEKASKYTLCLDYPKANVYWFVEFKKYVETKILVEEPMYKNSWNQFLEAVHKQVYRDYKKLKDSLTNISRTEILDTMIMYGLRNYQAYDLLVLNKKLEFFSPHTGLILSEQRTGKTRIAIAAADVNLHQGSVLVIVCPKSAMQGWEDEVQEVEKHLLVETYVGGMIKKVADIKNFNDNFDNKRINYRIITYDLLKRLTKTQLKTLVNLKNASDIMLIGDECHRLRNFKTDQSTALFELKTIIKKKDTYIIGVTGTPAVKDTCDIFGILSFVNFSKIKFKPTADAFAQFKEYFYVCEDTSYGKIAKALKKKAELNYLIQCCAIQTKQKELDMFKNYKKQYLKVELDMDDEQFKIYKEVDDFFEYGDDIDCKNPMVKYLRLQQICNDPSILTTDYTKTPPKFKYILGFAKKNNKQFIVMSKKLKALKHLAELLELNGITYSALDGSMKLEVRNQEIADFKSGKSQIFIIQSDVGREALTLPEASYTLFLDRDFAQGNNDQAEARMTPIDGSTSTKYVIDLIMKNSVENEIYEKLIIKKEDIKNVNEIFKKGETTK